MSGGSLRAAGYDEREQTLRVELTAGTFEYKGVSPEVWRRLVDVVVAVELLPRQHRGGVCGQTRSLKKASGGPVDDAAALRL